MTPLLKKKVSSRRQQVRNNLAMERLARLASAVNGPYPKAIVILILFIGAVTAALGVEINQETFMD